MRHQCLEVALGLPWGPSRMDEVSALILTAWVPQDGSLATPVGRTIAVPSHLDRRGDAWTKADNLRIVVHGPVSAMFSAP